MFAYVAIPSRLLGLRTEQSRRDKLSAAAVGGAIGAVICSPPYALGRMALIMIGSHTFRYLAVLLLIIAVDPPDRGHQRGQGRQDERQDRGRHRRRRRPTPRCSGSGRPARSASDRASERQIPDASLCRSVSRSPPSVVDWTEGRRCSAAAARRGTRTAPVASRRSRWRRRDGFRPPAPVIRTDGVRSGDSRVTATVSGLRTWSSEPVGYGCTDRQGDLQGPRQGA